MDSPTSVPMTLWFSMDLRSYASAIWNSTTGCTFTLRFTAEAHDDESDVDVIVKSQDRKELTEREKGKHNKLPQVGAGWQAVRAAIQVGYSAGGQKPEKEGDEPMSQ